MTLADASRVRSYAVFAAASAWVYRLMVLITISTMTGSRMPTSR